MIKDELIEKGLETLDDSVYSRGEQEADRTARHLADMKSDNPLAKMIRPLMALVVLSVWVSLQVYSIWKPDINVGSADAALMVVMGFYFVARSFEKINSKKTAAKIHQDRISNRHQRKMERRNKH
jgi:hypothetical protein